MLRFARSRSSAQAMVSGGHMRLNGRGVERTAQAIAIGDVLTFAQGTRIRVVEILSLPVRRGPANEARGHYREIVCEPQESNDA